MSNIEYKVGTYYNSGSDIPVPEKLKGKDARADLAARAAVFAAIDVTKTAEDINLETLNIIVLNRKGCQSYIKKVSDGVTKRVARQGFFARGGPHTLATYTALALGSHGSAFTIVGGKESLPDAITTAMFLVKDDTPVILTVVNQSDSNIFKAISVLLMATNINSDMEKQNGQVVKDIFKHLANSFNCNTD